MLDSQPWEPGDRWQEYWKDHVLPQIERAKAVIEPIFNYQHETEQLNLPKYFERDVLRISHYALPGFATLDPAFMASVAKLRSDLEAYIGDSTRRRPYNVLMIAPPGSGKSHFANRVASSLNTRVVTGNLSSTDVSDTLQVAIDEVRNYKAVDSIPVLFLDEVDSSHTNLPLLLPLLWDGEFVARGQRLRIGRCIILCALSNETLIRYVRSGHDKDSLQLMQQGFAKVQDFLSRFDGGILEIPSINDASRQHDKVCIAMELIRRRFGDVWGVQVSFLQFVGHAAFLNEVRSLEFFINSIPESAFRDHYLVVDELTNQTMQALLENYESGPLRYHLAMPQDNPPLKQWEQFVTTTEGKHMVEYDHTKLLFA